MTLTLRGALDHLVEILAPLQRFDTVGRVRERATSP